jgi:dTDP-4-dehydrorhamnose reductase
VGIYCVSKFLGEVRQLPSLTIRTSIIGRELNNNRNLLDWFLSTTSHSVNGFAQVYWNGVSTITIAKIIKLIIEENINFNKPLIQIASDTVTKYDLLCFFKDIFNKDIDIIKYLDTASNKTLIPSIEQEKFFKNLIPPIKNQIEELKKFYE